MAKRGLGSSAIAHRTAAARLAETIDNKAAHVINQVRNGRCKGAVGSYVDMLTRLGAYRANVDAGGATTYKPVAWQDAMVAFEDRCVRDPGNLSGPKRSKRKRRR